MKKTIFIFIHILLTISSVGCSSNDSEKECYVGRVYRNRSSAIWASVVTAPDGKTTLHESETFSFRKSDLPIQNLEEGMLFSFRLIEAHSIWEDQQMHSMETPYWACKLEPCNN